MSILNILREPNKLLRQKSAEIHVIDEEIKNLAKDMLETMYNAPGIGLAGGSSWRTKKTYCGGYF